MTQITVQKGLFGYDKHYQAAKSTILAAKPAVKKEMEPEFDMDGPRELGTFETMVKFKVSSLTQVDVYRRNGFKQLFNPNSVSNLLFQDGEGNAYNGHLSPATKRNIERMLQVWLTSIELNVDLKSSRNRVDETAVMPTFVTLTLPSVQMHSDNDIKEHILHPFINWLKQSSDEYYKRGGMRGMQKGFGVKGYFWRAETQQNGNIHFHLLCDKYVPWDRIRQKWNECCESLGYVTTYGYVQTARHKNGFKINNVQLERDIKEFKKIAENVQGTRKMPKKVSTTFASYLESVAKTGAPMHQVILKAVAREKQKITYDEGVKCGWTNPNSTDIHAIKNLGSVTAYVLKYLTKKSKEKPLAPNQELKFNETLNRQCIYTYEYQSDPENGTTQKVEVDFQYYRPKFKERKINGRIWGCADIIRGFKAKKGEIVQQDENGYKYVIEEVPPEMEEIDFDKDTGEAYVIPAPKYIKKPVYEMKYFTKIMAESLVIAPAERNQSPIYTDKEVVCQPTSDYISILTELIGQNTITATSMRVGQSFERMQGKIIPLHPEKLGFKAKKEGQRAIVKHADILKKFAPELHKEYLNYHKHIFTSIYGKAA
jgi:hypothetical protein